MKEPWFQKNMGVQIHNPLAIHRLSICYGCEDRQSTIRRRALVRNLVRSKLRVRKAIAVAVIVAIWIVGLTTAFVPPILFNFTHTTAFMWGLLLSSGSLTLSTVCWHEIADPSYIRYKGRKYRTF